MDIIEIETKEDIIAAAEIERRVAPELFSGQQLRDYLADLERKIRRDAENGTEYYLIYSSGRAGLFALINHGGRVELTKAEILPEYRRRGLFRRTLFLIEQTYDPQVIEVRAWGGDHPALHALGFTLVDQSYRKRLY